MEKKIGERDEQIQTYKVGGLYKLRIQFTRSLKPPGFFTNS